MPHAQSEKIIEAVRLNVISEQEACELLIALKRGDKEAIERLQKEHKDKL